jgi:SecD/SecF fusion protein
MQNKGAISLFAALLSLACAYYLMFTWVAYGIESDAKEYADNYANSPAVISQASNKSDDIALQKMYIDSVRLSKENYYLDSIKHRTVLNLLITEYTYEDVKKRQLNLGLDLKGGMNVTLEVSVEDIIRSMSNNTNDPVFLKALEQASVRYKKDPKDYVTIFGEEFKKLSPDGRLASYFQTIELKGTIDYNTSDKDVLVFLRQRVRDAIETAENTLRSRIDKFGVTQPNIQLLPSSGRILIELPGVTDKKRVRKLLQGTANLEFWETHENKDVYPLLVQANTRLKDILNAPVIDTSAVKLKEDTKSEITDKKDKKKKSKKEKEVEKDQAKVEVKKDTSTSTLAQQLGLGVAGDSTGKSLVKDDSIAKLRKENPLFSLLSPAVRTNEAGQSQLTEGPVVGYAYVGDTATINEYLNNPKVKSVFKPFTKFVWAFKSLDKEETMYQLVALDGSSKRGSPALTGDIITDARKVFDMGGGGSPQISMSMTAEAAIAWKHLTKDNIGKSVAIVLDNSVYSYPTVQSEISGGVSSITGNFTISEADDLVNILKAGKLPAPAKIVEENVVGPTLGAEAVSKGLFSTVIALVLVLLFMGLYYSEAGWVADIAMLVNNFFVIGILASFGAVLTLPGIAGIVLTIAMSVDANILIFERVREELLLGKSTAVSIKEGYKNAMSSVIDSHITTLLLGIILYVFGNGPIQGFATTLIIGVISSLFCAIFITRIIFDRWLAQNKPIAFGNKYTAAAFRNINIDFVGKRKLYYVFSGIIILAGIISYVQKGGFSLGVDFMGGRSYIVRFEKTIPTEEVREVLAKSFGEAPEVKTYGESVQQRITTTYLVEDSSDDAEAKVEEKLNDGLKDLGVKYQVMSSQKVGETVSRDIKMKAFWAVMLSCLVMLVFIVVRFKKVTYGLGALVALFHDVLIVLSIYIIFDGILPFSLEITQDFIAAILTVMSYSMVDSVVVFDRIREYLTERNKEDLDPEERVKVINYALNSTLSRTINTALTIFFVMFAIFAFGGETIRGFSFALMIGVAVGTYSSICIATPIVIDFERDNETKRKK